MGADEEDIREIMMRMEQELKAYKTQISAGIAERESKATMWMRLLVVGTFSIVGPILLLVYAANLSVDPTLLDILKIWLGAAIGISTNLLQRSGQPSVPAAKPQE